MNRKEIKKAVEVLNRGGIIIFPTDTAFAIGCRIDKEKAIKKLFALRKRPLTQAALVLVNSVVMAQKYFSVIPKKVLEKLIKPYWPGALTIVMKCNQDKVPELVRGGKTNIGMRMPRHKKILEIIKRVGVPILAPSANFHGGKTPFIFSELDHDLMNKVDFVVGGRCKGKKVSTVIFCSGEKWQVIRQGAVNLKI